MSKTDNLLNLFKSIYREKGLSVFAKVSGLTRQHLWTIYAKEKLTTYDPRMLAVLSLEKSDNEIMDLVRFDAAALRNGAIKKRGLRNP